MNEATRNEILRRWRGAASIRQIARDLHLARNTVSRVLAEVTAQRAGAREEASEAARDSQDESLDQHLPQDAPVAGAECRADRELAAAGARAHQQEVPDVHAGDEQDQCHHGHQQNYDWHSLAAAHRIRNSAHRFE